MSFDARLSDVITRNMAAIGHVINKHGRGAMSQFVPALESAEARGYSIVGLGERDLEIAALDLDAEDAVTNLEVIFLVLERIESRGRIPSEFRERALIGAARSILRSVEDGDTEHRRRAGRVLRELLGEED